MSDALSAHESTLPARRDEARRLAESGRALQAEQAYLELLRDAPQDVDALNFLALCAHERGQYAKSLALLQRASAAHADDATTLTNLAAVLRMLGRRDEAIDALASAVRGTPDFFVARLRLGEALDEAGRRDEAAPHYFGAIMAAQARGLWLSDATTEPPMRAPVLQAMRIVAAERRRLFSGAIEPLRARHGREAMARVEKCLAMQLQEMPTQYLDPRQRPKFLYFPDLPTQPFFAREEFPWYAALEERSATIREEMLATLAEDAAFEPFLGHFDKPEDLEGYLDGTRGKPAWNAFFFYRHGIRNEANHLRCPTTSAALDDVPLCRIRDHAPEVCYSVLTPGSHILPHRGVTNVRAVTHLALVVPDDCALVAGGEARAWEPDRCFTFDDTFEHEAWNRSDKTRVVMLMDVWNPYLTEAERDAITALIETIGDFNRAAGVN